MRSIRDTKTVAAIIDALTHVDGDSIARVMLIQGVTLADLIDSLLSSPIKNGEAIKLITQALGSDDFLIEPEIVGPSHIAYIYDPPESLHVVDIVVETTQGKLASKDIRVRLQDPKVV
jgi:glycosylphosphatidylinositol transamidase (GPIT) subunit GPI8